MARDLPDLQRGLRRHRRRRLDAARAVPGGAPARPDAGRDWCPASPRCTACRRCWSSRRRAPHARTDADGTPVLLDDQDRARWDQLLIRRGLAALDRAEALGRRPVGPYVLQAAIAACHARARRGRGHRLGARSPGCTTCSPGSPPARSSRSTGPWRTAGPSGPTPAWPCSTRSTTAGAGRAPTCCPASAATCWPGPAGRPRRPRAFRTAAGLTRNAERARRCCSAGPTRSLTDRVESSRRAVRRTR